MEVVVIIEMRASISGGAQDVFRASARTRRPAPLPYGQLAGTALDELPVNVEADSAQMEMLVHPVAHAERPVVGMVQLAVNRDPIPRRSGSMTVSHTTAGAAARSIEAVTRLIGEGRTVAGARSLQRVESSPCGQRLEFLPQAERVFDRRVEGVQAHAE